MFHHSLLLLTIFYTVTESGRIPEMMQTIAIRGQLKCDEKDVVNTVVILGINIRFADEQTLAITRTNTTGWFELKATIISTDIVRPFFHVKVDQSSGIKCSQRYKKSIPFEFITKYGQPERWYDVGIVDLQDICVKLPNETSCRNNNNS
ncbi:unnamed protein product [Cercopithifilaria johnstoni]|uniref:Transthyretin-like family protein n=1 Tax=Cercopithifilaria johnstoni TaxID=2874296 RepID=A0A8J2Q6J6_9BILA|nr:unnamed protein product [Cercopithifilaria johnstoni]